MLLLQRGPQSVFMGGTRLRCEAFTKTACPWLRHPMLHDIGNSLALPSKLDLGHILTKKHTYLEKTTHILYQLYFGHIFTKKHAYLEKTHSLSPIEDLGHRPGNAGSYG